MKDFFGQPQPVKSADRRKEDENDLVISYLTLRNAIGFLGMLLPFLLVVITWLSGDLKYWKPSISDYYYTRSGDVLVVVLSTLAVFLTTYKGYNWRENALTCLAALGALGVAFSPTTTKFLDRYSIHTAHPEGLLLHIGSAALFLISLAVMSIHYFTKSDEDPELLKNEGAVTKKPQRNRVYRVCGWTIIGCVGCIAAFFLGQAIGLFPDEPKLYGFPIVLFFEVIAVEAFGFAWLTKGETLWPDKKKVAGETATF